MPRQSIDYLNSRRELGADARKGKAIFSKASAAVDQRDQLEGLDAFERAMIEVRQIQASFQVFAGVGEYAYTYQGKAVDRCSDLSVALDTNILATGVNLDDTF